MQFCIGTPNNYVLLSQTQLHVHNYTHMSGNNWGERVQCPLLSVLQHSMVMVTSQHTSLNHIDR